MTGFSTYSSENILNYHTGKDAMPTLPVVYIALFTAVGTDAGTGFTEVSGGSYARVEAAASIWNSASSAIPSVVSNSGPIPFATPTANWGTVIAFGIYDAATAGNLLWWDYLGNDPWVPFSCTLASPGVLTAIGITANSNPTLANGATVVVSGEYGGSLPTGFSTGTTGVVAALSSDTFNIGVNTTSTGSGMVRQITSQVISTGVVASFAASALQLSQA